MGRRSTTEDCDLATFGGRVRSMRADRGLSLRFVAAECGRSLGYMCDLENGKRLPSADTLERLADVLGVSMDRLWRGV